MRVLLLILLIFTISPLLASVSGLSLTTIATAQNRQLPDRPAPKRVNTRKILAEYKEQASNNVEALINALSDKEIDVKAAAARELRKLGPAAKEAIPILIKQMQGYELTSKGEKLWVDYSKTLCAIGPDAVEPMVKALDSGDVNTFWGICQALHDIGPESKAALPEMLKRIKTEKGDRLYGVLVVIEGLGAEAKDATPDLVRILNDLELIPQKSDLTQIQMICCRALGSIGTDGRAAIPRLIELAKEGVVSTRGLSLIALGSMAQKGDQNILDALENGLKDYNQTVRERAMISLGRIGPEAISLLPQVAEAMSDENSFSNKPVAATTHFLISGESEPALKLLVKSIDKLQFEIDSIVAMGDIGPKAESALPVLIKKMNSTRDISIQEEIVRAFGKMGAVAEPTLPLIRTKLLTGDKAFRAVAAEAIKKIESAIKE